MQRARLIAAAISCFALALVLLFSFSGPAAVPVAYAATNDNGNLDNDLAAVLANAGFTGNIEQTFHERLEANLGRSIDPKLDT